MVKPFKCYAMLKFIPTDQLVQFQQPKNFFIELDIHKLSALGGQFAHEPFDQVLCLRIGCFLWRGAKYPESQLREAYVFNLPDWRFQ